MNILEHEIEDLVWNALTSDFDLLKSKGFPCYKTDTYIRQMELGRYGRADIVGFNVYKDEYGQRVVEFSVYELKKDQICASTFFQAVRYAKALDRAIGKKYPHYVTRPYVYLIGKSVDSKSDFIYVPDVMNNVGIYTYTADLKDGITFHEEDGYFLKDDNLDKLKNSLPSILKTSLKNRINYYRSMKYSFTPTDNEDLPF